ncbi:cyclodeaminase/cyclohydrolase family protein [Patescibacteria group bacterium]
MNKVKNLKISDYIERLSSSSPTPGGGATACIVGSFSASLIEMVCNLTLGKKNYEEFEEEIENILDNAKKINLKLLDLSDEDIKAFNLVMESFKLSDKKAKETKKEEAFKKATSVPLKVYLLTQKLETMSQKLFEIGNKNAFSDAKSAYHLAKAAGLSALENVSINLPYIKDSNFIKEVKAQIA